MGIIGAIPLEIGGSPSFKTRDINQITNSKINRDFSIDATT